MRELFNIDKFIQSWCTGIPKPYFDKLQAASPEELKAFRKAVVNHSKLPQKINFAPRITHKGIQKTNIHKDILLKAIDWELTHKNKLRNTLYYWTLPFRKWWIGLWHAREAFENINFGHVYKDRESGKCQLEYLGLKICLLQAFKRIKKYLTDHHWRIITAIISLLGIYIAWLALKK